jgi:DNA replication protein DnaC
MSSTFLTPWFQETRSTLVISQYPIETWHERIGDPTLADAIPNRLTHQAYRISLNGDSMRPSKHP